jgi:hypothetical protein
MNSLFHIYQEYESLWSQQEWHQNLFIPNYKEPLTHLLPMTTVVLYIGMVFLLPKFLLRINCKGMSDSTFLKILMAVWNLFLSVVSLVMMLGFLPHFLELMQQRGFVAMVCDRKHDLFLHEKMRFWVNMFILSKFVELMDTVFLIVKNPLRPGRGNIGCMCVLGFCLSNAYTHTYHISYQNVHHNNQLHSCIIIIMQQCFYSVIIA